MPDFRPLIATLALSVATSDIPYHDGLSSFEVY